MTDFQTLFYQVQNSTPVEICLMIFLILASILMILGIVYLFTLVLSKAMWILFQVLLLILAFYAISIFILNDEDSKELGKNISNQVEKMSDDFSNWYDNMQMYSWISGKLGLNVIWGPISHFGINVIQESVSNSIEGIKESFYNITNFWQ